MEDGVEVIRELLRDHPTKLVRLAKDIAESGTNPADIPIVIPSTEQAGKYVVVEGNRRLAAIRLLAEPALAERAGYPALKRKFEEAVKSQSAGVAAASLQCAVFESRDKTPHWIELRHTGQNEGIGIVDWDASAVARFKRGQSWLGWQAVQLVKEKGRLRAEALHRLPITTVARLINDPTVREALGLKVESGNLKAHFKIAAVVKALSKIVEDIAEKTIKVGDVFTKKQRETYMERLISAGFVPRSSAPTTAPWDLPTDGTISVLHAPRIMQKSRRTVIPKSLHLGLKQAKLRRIFKELQGINVKSYPNACAVLLRALLELSLNEYAKDQNIAVAHREELHKVLLAAVEHLEKAKLLTTAQLKVVRVAVAGKNALFSTDTFHAYVHNPNLNPKHEDLKAAWDDMELFMRTLWP